MERTLDEERPRATDAGKHDDCGRIAVEAGMFIFLIGLALLFVANAPS